MLRKFTNGVVMGGRGSGYWYRWNSKTTTESQHRVDIRWMKKQGYLRPGAIGILSWTCGNEQSGTISYRMETDRVILNYRHRPHGEEWEDVEQVISLDWTPCNYGGERTWFLCTHCNRRVAVLYGVGKYFLCRHCYNLTYVSQQVQCYERLMEKSRTIRQRLGGSANLSEPFPDKPKSMHWKTYYLLRQEAAHASQSSAILVAQQFGFDWF